MSKKIYLSPSNQNKNLYATGDTNEMEQCDKIATKLETLLKAKGFNVKKAPKGQSMSKTISESNSFGANLHLPIHTNAFNGELTGGTLIMLYSNNSENMKAGKCILEPLSKITPGKDYQIQTRPNLAELNSTNALAVYIEAEFHDTKEGSDYIIANIDDIAKAICDGVCDYFGVDKKDETTLDNMYYVRESPNYLKTQKGAFANLEDAKKMADSYAKSGYEVYDEDKKMVYKPELEEKKKEIPVKITSDVVIDAYTKYALSLVGQNGDKVKKWFPLYETSAWCAAAISYVGAMISNDILGNAFVKSAGAGSIPRLSRAKGIGKWFEGNKTPIEGDFILFNPTVTPTDKYFSSHIGYVYKVSNSVIYTVEGNVGGTNVTSIWDKRSYSVGNSRINGFFRPAWSKVKTLKTVPTSSSSSTQTSTTTKTSKIKAVQNWLNSNYKTDLYTDGVYGKNTKSALVKALQSQLNKDYNKNLVVDGIYGNNTKKAVVALKKGDKNKLVNILQGLLICRYDYRISFDGDFGNKTQKTVKAYQKAKKLTSDGVAGKNTFTKLLS